MANDVVFKKGQGGLGRPLPGLDHISGLLFYSGATLPTGFTSTDRIKKIFSVEDAVTLGITNTSLGETKSTASYSVTAAGSATDTFNLTCAIVGKAGLQTVTLASFTAVAADVATTTTMASKIASEINLGTPTHGFTATSSLGVVTITAAPGQGIYLNTGTPYVVTVSGTIAGTLTQNVVVGVASDIDILHYHISEYFRIQPKGILYVGIYATADVGTFSNVTDMQNFSGGELRQIGIYQKSGAFATTHVTTLQSVYNALDVLHKPVQIIYNAEVSGTASVTTLTNLRLLAAPNVSVTLGQDGKATGFKLFKATGKSIGCLGTTLGAVSLAAVNEDIAWVGKFNVSNVEFDTLNFANGQALTSLSDGTINNVDTFGYIFLKKHIDITGSYFDDSHTATPVTGDYAYIENGRTIDKAIRNLRAFLLPFLASPLLTDSAGKLSNDTVSFFESLSARALEEMQRSGEISSFTATINPSQNVLATSNLIIAVSIRPAGVARTITVNVGFKN